MLNALGRGSPAMKLLTSLKVSTEEEFFFLQKCNMHSVVELCLNPLLPVSFMESRAGGSKNFIIWYKEWIHLSVLILLCRFWVLYGITDDIGNAQSVLYEFIYVNVPGCMFWDYIF